MRVDLVSADGGVSGTFLAPPVATKPLLVCIHGGGCNGRYFDLKGYSTAAMASARGFPVLLVNRPGYGGNPLARAKHPVEDSVEPIRAFIDDVRSRHRPGDERLLLLAHSIGGAVALMLAAHRDEWPLVGIAVSGISDRAAPVIREASVDPAAGKGEPPEALTADMFFGPPGSYGWDAVPKLRHASEAWVYSEIVEIVHEWPVRWLEIAARVDVPVHFRLAEHEKIWETGQEVVDRIAARLTSSPRVDAAMLPDGGHLYEIHKRGAEFVASQLDFLEACCAPAR